MPEMIRHWQDEQGMLRIAAAGRWTLDEAQALDQQLRDISNYLKARITSVCFDLGEVSELDTCGAALLITTHERLAAALDVGYLLQIDLMRFETVYPPSSDMPEI